MLEESKDLIIKNFLILMNECNVDTIKQLLIDNGIFSTSEMSKIFLSDDARHNKRIFFFSIQKKEQIAFKMLIECLKKTNQHNIVKLLVPEDRGIRVFCASRDPDEDETSIMENIPLYVSNDTMSLNIKVVKAREFCDTTSYNKKIEFYSTRSKKRGRVLIINNYNYMDNQKHPYRNGAEVDTINLHKLFNQMGGWEIHHQDNATGEQMIHLMIQFSQNKENKLFDICFVIIMGHGQEEDNQTIIYGIDGKFHSSNKIQQYFTNEKCTGFRGKPKVFLFQACRGSALDHTIRHTETDSARHSIQSNELQLERIDTHIRIKEDILLGFATLHGFKAHRDPNRGSWYIELVCKHFMNDAKEYPIHALLQMVDQDLRRRMSEGQTMQTSQFNNKGFKNLYFNPGIYYEDGALKHFPDF